MNTSMKGELKYFVTDIEATRASFINELRKLPKSIGTISISHVENRIARAHNDALLGEYAPWFIADILNINNKDEVKKVAIAWLHVYFSTMLIDDIIDRHGLKYKQSIVASSLLLQRGVSNLLRQSNRTNVLGGLINDAFINTADAALLEIDKHRNNINEYSKNDIDCLGKKIGLLKLCIDSIADICGRRSSPDWLVFAFEQLATGIQLLDDITDWEEDLKAKNMTLPLTILMNWQKGDVAENGYKKYPLISLIKSEAFEKTLIYAAEALGKTASVIRKAEKNRLNNIHTLLYVERLIANISLVKNNLKLAKIKIIKYQCQYKNKNIDSNSMFNEANSYAIREAIDSVRSALKMIAQNS